MVDLLIIIATVLLLHFVIGKYPEPLPRSENPKKEVWEAIGFTALVSIAVTVLLLIVPEEALINKTPRWEFLGSLALSPFIFVIPLLYVLRVDKWTSKDLGFTKPRSWAVLIFALLLFGYAGTRSLFTDPSRVPLSLPLILIALFQPALTEELLFRGIIQRKLERALGQNKAWIYSGILFGLVHVAPNLMGAQWYDYGQDIGNMIGLLIQQIIVGWIFGIIYMKSRSLLPSFLAHFFTDWRLGSIIKLLFY
jgi:membrane protease YdiL (CAAX protease family)